MITICFTSTYGLSPLRLHKEIKKKKKIGILPTFNNYIKFVFIFFW
jgi:hypothetical protein